MILIANIFNQYPWLFAVIAVWDLAWKGLALWRTAKTGRHYWFIVILVVNSVGLLPIVYLAIDHFGWFKPGSRKPAKTVTTSKRAKHS